jgi:uncharacterized membrane protein YedE/YeeE
MYEDLNITFLTAPQAAVVFAALLGLAFGFLAERTRFCFRRALVGEDRAQAAAVWFTALAVAVIGTQLAVAQELTTFGAHRFQTENLSWLSIALGGALFGAGMILARGCAARLTVLAATGNLRAGLVMVVFAITAHATLKGALAPLAAKLSSVSAPIGGALPGAPMIWAAAIALLAVAFVVKARPSVWMLIGAGLIGLLVPLAWVGTGYVLYDDFDPIVHQSLSFTSTWTETLFAAIAYTAVPLGFGTGLVLGTIAGAFLSAALGRRLAWQSFTTPGETGRYMSGALLMGIGGVLAGGCTIGAGLSGIPTLSVAAVLALASITLGAVLTQVLLSGKSRVGALQPAE